MAAGQPLTQGDLVLDCPRFGWKENANLAGLTADPTSLSESIEAFREDSIVMTQACDLENRKVNDVVLCPCIPRGEYRHAWEAWMHERKQTVSEKAWKRTCEDVAAGYVWNLAFLSRFDHAGAGTDIRVVDFHRVYTAPLRALESVLAGRQGQRARLRPPYREHLSQAFARFFMRVGLPQSVAFPWDKPDEKPAR